MYMFKIKNLFVLLISIILISAGLSSCSDDEPSLHEKKENLVLIYAVAANNLQYNLLYNDIPEILKIAKDIDLNKNKVLLYSVIKSGECKLQELQKTKNGNYEFVTIKEYDKLPLSTSGERIFEVLDFVKNNFDYEHKGLILWSHATGWIPSWNGSTPENKRKTFGSDTFEGVNYQTNINELAEAIPDDVFDYIWFDCCYMANIETIYQLREKAHHIVGYVTEIHSDGMPYDRTLPDILKGELTTAAMILYNYYNNKSITISVSIVDTSKLGLLAEASSKVFLEGVGPASNELYKVQNYGRQGYKFYDMGQLLDKYGLVSVQTKEELKDALNEAVIFKAISDLDFNDNPINIKDYSGLSIHYYTNDGSKDNIFYQQLDWYKATRTKVSQN